MSRIYGYGRISRKTQKIERQVENISKAYPTAIITTEAFTGTKIDRPEFAKLLKKISTGDTIVFDSVSRMSRNAEEGKKLYFELFDKGIELVFLKESYINTAVYREAISQSIDVTGNEIADIYIEATNKVIKLIATKQIEKAFEQAQKEVDDLHERTSEGLREAKRKGKRVGCSKGDKLVTKKSIEAKEKIRKYNNTFGGALNNEDTWKLIGISKMTFYKYKNEMMAAEQ
ncbi:MAG: recombinase family protein [Negativicutes bacterium]|nr:recombinase family protein [Negativicutes bacterium]